MTSSGQSPRYFKMNARASRCRPASLAKRSPFANLRPRRQIFAFFARRDENTRSTRISIEGGSVGYTGSSHWCSFDDIDRID